MMKENKKESIGMSPDMRFWHKWYTSDFLKRPEVLMPVIRAIENNNKALESCAGSVERETLQRMKAMFLNSYLEDLQSYLQKLHDAIAKDDGGNK